MTGLLDDVLRERGDSVDPPHLDVDTIIANGDRRVRRTRLTTGLAAAAVGGVLAVGTLVVPTLLPSGGEGQVAAPSAPFADRRISYAIGDVIHWGDRTFPVEGEVVSYVQTDHGFVYAGRDGSVRLFDGTDSQRIGHAQNGNLRADDTGPLVAWVDLAEDKAPQYVVYDTESRREVARVDDDAAGAGLSGDDGGAYVYALDDGSAYWRVEEGIARYDITAGRTELVSPTQDGENMENAKELPRRVADVANGLIAYPVSDLSGNRLFVGPSVGAAARKVADGFNANLSPGGTYVAVENGDQISFHATATGATVDLALDGSTYRFAFGWVDDTTAMVIEFVDLEADPVVAELRTCDLVSRSCRTVTDVDFPADDPETFVVPSGEPMT